MLTKNYELFPPGICFADQPGAGASAGGAPPSGAAAGAGAAAPAAGAGAAAPAAAGATPWYETKDFGLDDDGKRFIASRNFADLKTAVRSHIEADTLARSRNVMERPDPSKLNEWKGWSELGWVEDPSKYVFKAPEKLPPGITYSGELMDKLRGAAHAARVPLGAAQQIHDTVWSYLLDGVQKLEADGARGKQELETKLRGTWGLDYARNSELARRAAAAFNPTPEDASLVGKIMGEPALMQMFHKIGEQIGEAHLPAEGTGTGTAAGGLPPTIAATEAELNRLEADPGFLKVLNDNRHPQHKDFIAQRQRLIGHLARLQSRAA